ncbi:tripartite tricarboxylate transporter family receptor [Variibacter gotjawalensis]|uniref:Tripartite tricarboxylate transporter family receptor n=1 Tax=Variibacter gotjawalensis TaxID=1333996 RepID=A0A0S3PQ73_9BRAD|nr:tripartite tricarboxylate transporter substrate binding protein [Variibacter gotjawalensis]NIK48363.1 tripartite-type tricarboxylate transporter receptor subunit TctC [Variibacter gotjawalensis]RZS50232.1 tripartite-type tricarboxylate transporter receptor subunit TctC [Variibacter gotjawalensis]BAT58063.1 tripartite tricarboxylate transporter family receptor [Variibacter gotjawalensis]
MLDRRQLMLGTAAAVAASATSASAQAYPNREVTLIVPWNAGGSNDIMARALQPLLKEQGISIIVENVAGATGTVGMRRVAAAAPDGYTIGMGTSSTLAVIAQGKTPLKNEDFTHLARISTDPLMLLVPAKGPHQTIEQFIAHMKQNPGKVSIGTPGTYNVNHIFAAMTAKAAGVEYTNVPYPGGAKVVGDLTGGHIQAGVLKPSETIAQIQDNLIKPLGVFANERLAVFPDVPTFKEKGIDVFPYGPIVQMAYLAGPANLPPEIRERIIGAFRKAMLDQRFKTFSDQNSFLVDDLTGKALDEEVGKVAKALKAVAEQVFPKEASN